MSDSVWPHRRQPTKLPRPWDSPGKNTGVGCHFLLQWMKVKSESEVAQLCPTLSDPMDCRLSGSSIHGIFQAKVLEWGAIAFSERTNPREYQIVRTHKKGNHLNTRPSVTQPPVAPNASKQQTKQKYKLNHQLTGLPPHSALPIRGKTNKETKTQHKSQLIGSLHKPRGKL